MRKNSCLGLPDSPDRNIWPYLSVMKVTPIVMDDFLLVILTILINRPSKIDLCKVHNLPALNPDFGVQFPTSENENSL